MLDLEKQLHFPKLITVERTIIGNPLIDYCLYSVNWYTQESPVHNNYFCKIKKINSKICYNKLPSTLPEPYDSMIKNAIFCLTEDAIAEIRRCCYAALLDCNFSYQSNSFNLSGMVTKACTGYMDMAFRIIADGIIDEQTNFFSRDYSLKTIIFHSMLYKFWCYQVDISHNCEYSGIYNLAQVNKYAQTITEENIDPKITEFLATIYSHQKTIQNEIK